MGKEVGRNEEKKETYIRPLILKEENYNQNPNPSFRYKLNSLVKSLYNGKS